MADESDVLFQEIEDDLRQDQANKFWTDYGKYIVGAAVALVIGVASLQGWKAYDLKQRQEAGEAFAVAQKFVIENKSDEALKAFDAIAGKGSGYGVLAKFRSAALLNDSGDLTGSIATYKQLAEDSGVSVFYQNMAIIIGAFAELDNKDTNEALIGRTGALNSANNPWRHSAREILALNALKNGDNTKASEFFKVIAEDATTPQSMKMRASEMLIIIGG